MTLLADNSRSRNTKRIILLPVALFTQQHNRVRFVHANNETNCNFDIFFPLLCINYHFTLIIYIFFFAIKRRPCKPVMTRDSNHNSRYVTVAIVYLADARLCPIYRNRDCAHRLIVTVGINNSSPCICVCHAKHMLALDRHRSIDVNRLHSVMT